MMKNALIHLAAAILTGTGFLSVSAAAEPPSIMGRWEGKFINPVQENGYMQTHPNLCAEVVGLGGDKYRVRFFPRFFKRAHMFQEFDAMATDGVIRFNQAGWKGEIAPGSFTGEAFADGRNPLKFSLTKSDFVSSTMGMKPPGGATVLFDGKNLDAWQGKAGKPARWLIQDHSVLEVVPSAKNADAGGSIRTKAQFGDISLHLEFQLPYEPGLNGQNRGNSGVFLQGLYEVQVLDSFGLEGKWNECGAIYQMAPPKVNACLPPGEWQTYDILFRAARFGPDGSVSEFPRITVRMNGVLVQYNEELPDSTHTATSIQKPMPVPKEGPIELQDHSHPVRYRNIWAAPLPDSAAALMRRD